MPNLSAIQGKKCVNEKCLPLTPFGIPVEPDVNDSVPTLSGPSTMPVGVSAFDA